MTTHPSIARRLRQTKKVYAWETGPVDNLALALLCGDCEFKVCIIMFKGYMLTPT